MKHQIIALSMFFVGSLYMSYVECQYYHQKLASHEIECINKNTCKTFINLPHTSWSWDPRKILALTCVKHLNHSTCVSDAKKTYEQVFDGKELKDAIDAMTADQPGAKELILYRECYEKDLLSDCLAGVHRAHVDLSNGDLDDAQLTEVFRRIRSSRNVIFLKLNLGFNKSKLDIIHEFLEEYSSLSELDLTFSEIDQTTIDELVIKLTDFSLALHTLALQTSGVTLFIDTAKMRTMLKNIPTLKNLSLGNILPKDSDDYKAFNQQLADSEINSLKLDISNVNAEQAFYPLWTKMAVDPSLGLSPSLTIISLNSVTTEATCIDFFKALQSNRYWKNIQLRFDQAGVIGENCLQELYKALTKFESMQLDQNDVDVTMLDSFVKLLVDAGRSANLSISSFASPNERLPISLVNNLDLLKSVICTDVSIIETCVQSVEPGKFARMFLPNLSTVPTTPNLADYANVSILRTSMTTNDVLQQWILPYLQNTKSSLKIIELAFINFKVANEDFNLLIESLISKHGQLENLSLAFTPGKQTDNFDQNKLIGFIKANQSLHSLKINGAQFVDPSFINAFAAGDERIPRFLALGYETANTQAKVLPCFTAFKKTPPINIIPSLQLRSGVVESSSVVGIINDIKTHNTYWGDVSLLYYKKGSPWDQGVFEALKNCLINNLTVQILKIPFESIKNNLKEFKTLIGNLRLKKRRIRLIALDMAENEAIHEFNIDIEGSLMRLRLGM